MKWYKNFVVFWTLIYVTIAFIGRFTTSNKEIFPFFRWSLYSKTPNDLTFPYVMVNKIGDSIVTPPINLLDLNAVHHLSLVDANLNVADFYSEMIECKENEIDYQGDFLEILPKYSEFDLFVRYMDLSEIDYKAHSKAVKILSMKNNTITHFER